MISCEGIPYHYEPISITRGDTFPIWRPCNREHISAMTHIGVHICSRSHIPDLHCRIVSSDGKVYPVGRPGQGVYTSAVITIVAFDIASGRIEYYCIADATDS